MELRFCYSEKQAVFVPHEFYDKDDGITDRSYTRNNIFIP